MTNDDLQGHAHDRTFAISLMQHLVVPTFVLDPQCRVIVWNRACERLTGVAAADVMGTSNHWQAFYSEPRMCLADVLAQGRADELDTLYSSHTEPSDIGLGVKAENWCVMPRVGKRHYLAIDAGPIYAADGQLLAVIETLRDMTDQKLAQIALERLATLDGLTGIANRRHFDERLQNEWSRATRSNAPLSLIMADVDYFKRYNDTYGHQQGDECLKAVSAVFQQLAFRVSDLAARYGGEEFAVILPHTDQNGAHEVAERIRVEVEALALPHAGSEVSSVVTMSLGVATVTPGLGTQPKALLSLADQALYQAKEAGRNRVFASAESGNARGGR